MDRLVFWLVFSIIIGPGIAYGKIYLFHIMAICIILVYLLVNNKDFKLSKPNFSIGIFVVIFFWSILSLFWTLSLPYTLSYIFYLSNGIFIVLLLFFYLDESEKFQTVFKAIFISFNIQLVICLLEIFTSFRYPLSPYSQYAYLFRREAINFSDLTFSAVTYIANTPTGFMGNPNNLAIVINLLLPYYLFVLKLSKSYLSLIAMVIVLILTGSRGGIASFILILLIYLALQNYKIIIRLIILLPVFSFIFIFLYNFLVKLNFTQVLELNSIWESIKKYLGLSQLDQFDSIGIRQQLIQNGLSALKDSNYWGVGSGASKVINEINGSPITSMHNFWVEFLVENGFILSIIFFLWYITVIFLMLKKYIQKRSNDNLAIYYGATALSLIGFIPSSITASTVVYLLPMWMIFGVAISLSNFRKKERQI